MQPLDTPTVGVEPAPLAERVDTLERENADLTSRLKRVEAVLRNLGTVAAFVDHPHD